MLSGCTVPLDSKETELELENSKQEASLSAGKNTGIVLVPWCTWKSVPIEISGGVVISEIHWNHVLQQMSSQ